MSTAEVNIRRTPHLDSADVADVLALASAAGDTDGAYPLSEHVVLHLRHGGEAPAEHLLARDPDGFLAGYAHVDTTDRVEGPSAELVVHPLRRRRGLGRALVTAVLAVADETDGGAAYGRLRLWAHGDHPSAGALALGLGFTRARVLLQMRRSLYAPVPEPTLPPGVRLRAFRPGVDDATWVTLNARAFANHPDQGRWTLRDLRVRMAEPWFDPAGFLLAVREPGSSGESRGSADPSQDGEPGLGGEPGQDGELGQDGAPGLGGACGSDGELLGFHWTKVHGEVHRHPHLTGVDPHPHEPIGEVYVLGVDPSAHGLGLGTALTLAGLRHLRGHGLAQAMLYVDESNTAAIALYGRLGFARWSTDVSYRRHVPA